MIAVEYNQLLDDYNRIEQAINYLAENFHQQPSLEEVASSVNLSEYHFQRLFSRWVGISPKRFLQYLTKEYAKELLDRSSNLMDVTYQAGLSSPGRLHDLFVKCEAMTPGEYKNQGQGLEIAYGFHPSPFGECLLAATERGICWLSFVQGSRQQTLDALKESWQKAELYPNPQLIGSMAEQIFRLKPEASQGPLTLLLKGTNFQIKVWEALLRIPSGSVVSYEDIAVYIGMPKAVRAVGHAIGLNPIPYIIPCHRVIRKAGEFGNYGGGRARKMAILGWEMAKADPALIEMS